MKLERANEELQKMFADFIEFERTLINSLPDEEWDISESNVVVNCDSLITLEEDPKPGEDPLNCGAQFGVGDMFAAFTGLMNVCRRKNNGNIYYFVHGQLMLFYVGDVDSIKARIERFEVDTSRYYAQEKYKALTNKDG